MIYKPPVKDGGSPIVSPAQPTAYDLEQRAVRSRKKLEECFKEFHELVQSKVLDKNKTTAMKNTERKVVDDLLHSVVAMEQANQGQGFLSLLTISIREHLALRDRINELEYELYVTKRDLKNLQGKENSGGDDEKK